jgi:hypothetical protein
MKALGFSGGGGNKDESADDWTQSIPPSRLATDYVITPIMRSFPCQLLKRCSIYKIHL